MSNKVKLVSPKLVKPSSPHQSLSKLSKTSLSPERLLAKARDILLSQSSDQFLTQNKDNWALGLSESEDNEDFSGVHIHRDAVQYKNN